MVVIPTVHYGVAAALALIFSVKWSRTCRSYKWWGPLLKPIHFVISVCTIFIVWKRHPSHQTFASYPELTSTVILWKQDPCELFTQWITIIILHYFSSLSEPHQLASEAKSTYNESLKLYVCPHCNLQLKAGMTNHLKWHKQHPSEVLFFFSWNHNIQILELSFNDFFFRSIHRDQLVNIVGKHSKRLEY